MSGMQGLILGVFEAQTKEACDAEIARLGLNVLQVNEETE